MGSIVGEAFLAPPRCFHAAAIHHRNNNDDINDKLRFATTSTAVAGTATTSTMPSSTTTIVRIPRCRRKHALVRCAVEMQASPFRSTPPPPPVAVGPAAAVAAGVQAAAARRPGHARRRARATAPCSMSAGSAAEEGDGGVLGPLRPLSPTEDGSDVFNPNPLARNDPERARVSREVAYFMPLQDPALVRKVETPPPKIYVYSSSTRKACTSS